MNFNPFKEKPKSLESTIMSFTKISHKPFDKDGSAYTRVRQILMNGTEFEAVWCKHHFHRHCLDNDVRRQVALLRRCEQQQQKLVAGLKPVNESILVSTIGYEQLAVDLTAFLAQRTKNLAFKDALDFALLEDFDHLYRYANLMENDTAEHAEKYVGSYTEIMPARPTVAHHRHPYDAVNFPLPKDASLVDKLDAMIITAAEQQTMNYYMNIAGFYKNTAGKNLYTEIGMIEEQHVTEYGSFLDATASPFVNLLMHEYTEAYLYYSMSLCETDKDIKSLYEMLLEQEIAHLFVAKKLMEKHDKKSYEEVIGEGTFPEPIKLHENINYVRDIIKNTVNNTKVKEGYCLVKDLNDNADFFKYQNKVCKNVDKASSHLVIKKNIEKNGQDYRFETKEHPLKELRDRKSDNNTLARTK